MEKTNLKKSKLSLQQQVKLLQSKVNRIEKRVKDLPNVTKKEFQFLVEMVIKLSDISSRNSTELKLYNELLRSFLKPKMKGFKR